MQINYHKVDFKDFESIPGQDAFQTAAEFQRHLNFLKASDRQSDTDSVASSAMGGHFSYHQQLERKIAEFYRRNGYQYTRAPGPCT